MTTFDLKLHMAYKMAAGKRFPFPVPAWFAVWTVAVSLAALECYVTVALSRIFDETKLAGLVSVEQMTHFRPLFSGRIGTCSYQNQVKFNFKQDFKILYLFCETKT